MRFELGGRGGLLSLIFITIRCGGNGSFSREIIVTAWAIEWREFILVIFREVLEYFVLIGSILRLVLTNLQRYIFHLLALQFTILLSFIRLALLFLPFTLPYQLLSQHFIPLGSEPHHIARPQHFSRHLYRQVQFSQICHLLTPISPTPSHQPKNHSEKLHLLISHLTCPPCSRLCLC